jgi:hypothetical protein
MRLVNDSLIERTRLRASLTNGPEARHTGPVRLRFFSLCVWDTAGVRAVPSPVAPSALWQRAAKLLPDGSDLSAWTIAASAFRACLCDENPSECAAVSRDQLRASCM